jgi:hypothetical protein
MAIPSGQNQAQQVQVFTPLYVDDILTDQEQVISEAVWSTGEGALVSYYTSSVQFVTQSSGKYYVDVYQADPITDVSAAVQFSIAYGNRFGSGSKDYDNTDSTSLTPSRGVYTQFKNWLLPPNYSNFLYGENSEKTMDHFGAIVFARARMKGQIDPSNWELWLKGSGTQISLVDDSSINSSKPSLTGDCYAVVSGTLSSGGINRYLDGTTPVHYGLFYPHAGVILLDGGMLSESASITIDVGSDVDVQNHSAIYAAISASAVDGTEYAFQARNLQKNYSNYYFIRVKNSQYNYSTNPSFVTGSAGQVRYNSMVSDPKVFATSVGLYNDDNELLAVAKISKPILNDFTREFSLRVKLDF